LESGTKLLTNKKIGVDTKSVFQRFERNFEKRKIKMLGISEDRIVNLDKSFKIISQNVTESDRPKVTWLSELKLR
jgi:ABC-2 type transport system permease protein